MIGQVAKRLAASSAIYGLGGALQKLLGFVLLPIYTRYLSPEEYGVLALLLATGGVAAILLQTGMGSALFREILYERTEPTTVESTALYYVGVQGVLLAGVLLLLSPAVSFLIFGTVSHAPLLRLVFLTVAVQLTEVLALARCRIRNQPGLYATLSILRFGAGAALTILFVVGQGRGVEGVVTATLLTSAGFSLVYLTLLRQALRPRLSRQILRRLLTFGGPLVPASLASFVMTSADRYFLQHLTTTAEVGIYSLGYSIGLVMQLAVQAIQLAWPAEMYAIARREDGSRLLARTVTYYVVGMGLVGLGVAVLAREVLVLLATPRFYGAHRIVPFVVVSSILQGLWFMTSSGTDVRNKTAYTVPIISLAAGANLALNWVLIPRFGMMGAATTTVLSYAVLLAINVPVNIRLWHVPYEYGRLFKIGVVWVAVYLSSGLIGTGSAWLDAALKILLLGLYPSLLYAARFFDDRERRAMKSLFRDRWERIGTAFGRP